MNNPKQQALFEFLKSLGMCDKTCQEAYTVPEHSFNEEIFKGCGYSFTWSDTTQGSYFWGLIFIHGVDPHPTSYTLDNAVKTLLGYFTSGNSIEIEKATIPTSVVKDLFSEFFPSHQWTVDENS